MKLTVKGQVTIPGELRKRFGLKPRGEVVFEAAEGGVLIKPAPQPRVAALKAALRKARGSAGSGRSTAEIMRLTRGDE